jgi:hypothetical protein
MSWMVPFVVIVALAGALVALVRLLRPRTSVTRAERVADDADQ